MPSNWKRDVAFGAAGLAAGIIGSRLLAPVAAMAGGSLSARMGRDPFDRLIQDHRDIRSVLDEMEQCETDERARRIKLYLLLKRTVAKHALAEEDVVYPMLQDNAGSAQESKHLYDEHADMKIHLFELERMLKHNEDWKGRVADLRNLIAEHIRDEEEVQFPKLRNMLDERRTRTLTRQIHREEALIL